MISNQYTCTNIFFICSTGILMCLCSITIIVHIALMPIMNQSRFEQGYDTTITTDAYNTACKEKYTPCFICKQSIKARLNGTEWNLGWIHMTGCGWVSSINCPMVYENGFTIVNFILSHKLNVSYYIDPKSEINDTYIVYLPYLNYHQWDQVMCNRTLQGQNRAREYRSKWWLIFMFCVIISFVVIILMKVIHCIYLYYDSLKNHYQPIRETTDTDL